MCSVVSQICILQLKKYICDYRDTHARQNGFRHGRTFHNQSGGGGWLSSFFWCNRHWSVGFTWVFSLALFLITLVLYNNKKIPIKGDKERRDLQRMFGTPSRLPFSVVYASEKFIVKCFTIWKLWDFAIVSPEQIKVQYNEGLPVCLYE